jgi:hypothetical protein
MSVMRRRDVRKRLSYFAATPTELWSSVLLSTIAQNWSLLGSPGETWTQRIAKASTTILKERMTFYSPPGIPLKSR